MGRLNLIAVCAVVLLVNVPVLGQHNAAERAEWNKPIEPFRIIGNIYYVGVAGVSSFLIATPKGHVLIDGGLAESVPIIEKNIATLGFRIRDVKYLLNSHAHYDHCGGLAALKRASGAQMLASRADAETLESGRHKNYSIPDSLFPPVKVDRRITDGEEVEIGGVKLTALLTPGHTKGCTTWTAAAHETGKTYRVVFYCSTTAPGYPLVSNSRYPEIASDYERTFSVLRALPCDVFLAPHGSFFHLMEKREAMSRGGSNPFIDPGEMRLWVEQSEQEFQQELAAQQESKNRR